MSKTRVVVAMSGGVDSCVAAALLRDQGYDVVGITMQLWNHGDESDGRFDSCCSLTDVHDARVAADQIGVPHYLVNYEKEFRTGVVDYFANEYSAGRTPNPCVMCNSKMKFDHLIERAAALGAEWIATGHYARVVHSETGGVSELYRANDPRKDQSYFLFGLKPSMLKRVMFPLADLTKDEVRAIAERYGLHTSAKHESQEICFVTNGRYTDFLDKNYPAKVGTPGDIVDREGRVLGRHEGIHMFTVGQRKGLLLNTPEAKYVAAIDAASNRVIVDDLSGLSVDAFSLSGVNWFVDPEQLRSLDNLSVVVRYRAPAVPAMVFQTPTGEWRVEMATSARWVTPGQAAVIYQGDRVIGGGFIGTPERTSRAKVDRATADSVPAAL